MPLIFREKCTFLEEDLHAAQEHSKNLRAELQDTQATLNSLQQRQQEERRRMHAEYEQRIRQNNSTIDVLNKELAKLREQFADEKEQLTESFNRQISELTLQNQMLNEKVSELTASLKKSPTQENAMNDHNRVKVGWFFLLRDIDKN